MQNSKLEIFGLSESEIRNLQKIAGDELEEPIRKS